MRLTEAAEESLRRGGARFRSTDRGASQARRPDRRAALDARRERALSEPARGPELERPRLAPRRGPGVAAVRRGRGGCASRLPSFAPSGRRDYLVRRLLALSDVIALALALALALTVFHADGRDRQLLWGLPTLPVWVVLFKALRPLRPRHQADQPHDRGRPALDLPRPAPGRACCCGSSTGRCPRRNVEALPILGFGAIAMFAVPLARAVTRRARGGCSDPSACCSSATETSVPALIRKMRTHPEYGLEPVGSSPPPHSGRNGNVSRLGTRRI